LVVEAEDLRLRMARLAHAVAVLGLRLFPVLELEALDRMEMRQLPLQLVFLHRVAAEEEIVQHLVRQLTEETEGRFLLVVSRRFLLRVVVAVHLQHLAVVDLADRVFFRRDRLCLEEQAVVLDKTERALQVLDVEVVALVAANPQGGTEAQALSTLCTGLHPFRPSTRQLQPRQTYPQLQQIGQPQRQMFILQVRLRLKSPQTYLLLRLLRLLLHSTLLRKSSSSTLTVMDLEGRKAQMSTMGMVGLLTMPQMHKYPRNRWQIRH